MGLERQQAGDAQLLLLLELELGRALVQSVLEVVPEADVGQRSARALDLLPPNVPPEGYEVVPSADAEALVAYLLSLNRNYPLPEAPEPTE